MLFALITTGAWAQTNVTSTYLTNADFSKSTALTSTYLYGYKKDGTPANFQTVDGWTSVVTKVNNSGDNAGGYAGGVFAYGSATHLKGNDKGAPANSPSGETTGNCFGFFSVWGAGGYYYQEVTFPAGDYTLTFPIYNQSGTQANTSYTGFFPTSGTAKTVAINPAVGSWANQTVSFSLAAETKGQIRIGYESTGGGSGANPMLFYGPVKIEFTAAVIKTVLATALTAANTANATLHTLDDAIATAQAVYNNENATQDEVNAAAAALNTAVELAMSDAGDASFLIPNLGFEDCTVTTTNAAAGGSAAPLNIDGSWTQTANAAWSSSAVVEYGGTGQVNGVSAPSADNAGNTGKTLGVSVGWGGTVTYQSASATLPAGVYTVKVNGYNALEGVTQFKSMFGFVPTEGTATLSTKTAFTYGTWEEEVVTFTLNEATEGAIQVGGQAISGGSGSNAKVFFDNITIGYKSFLAGAKEAYDKAVEDAETAKAECANVTGEELTALNAELAKAEPTTVEGYNEATAALEAATATLVAAKPSYDALVTEIAYAQTIDVETTDAEAVQNSSETTSATALAATQTLKVLEYNTINTNYPNDVTSLLGTWDKGSYDNNPNDEGYKVGDSYFDKWNGSALEPISSVAITLPAGKYSVRVAGRGQEGTTMNLTVKVGENDAVSTPFLIIGNTGYGIDTDGNATYSSEATYSSSTGRGWQYRYLTFETTGEEVTISIKGHLEANTWQSFYAPVLLCDDATAAANELANAKAELQNVIKDAPAVNPNSGDAAFQLPAAGVKAYSDVLTAAQTAHDASNATLETIAAAKSALEAAIATYQALEINAPEDGQLFNVVLTYDGWTYDNKAMTFIAGGRADAGNYSISYQAEANQNLAQAFTFTKVEGNNYKMSQIDADGEVRYMCTGKVYEGGNDNQIRTTINADDAMLVTVIPTATEGVWNLKNVAANQYIGSQDNGVYTVNSHIDFQLVETQKPSITINTKAAGWGTVMLPFAVTEIPEDVKVYSCAEANGASLTLVEVYALKANKPYIIEGKWEADLTGDAQGTALTYTEGLLTGTYAKMAAPNGCYILQKQGEKVGFFKVDTSVNTPNVGANRAYLTAPAGSEIKAFDLGGDTDGINSLVNDLQNGDIYDLAGRKVQRMQKGNVYIVNGKKVVVK